MQTEIDIASMQSIISFATLFFSESNPTMKPAYTTIPAP